MRVRTNRGEGRTLWRGVHRPPAHRIARSVGKWQVFDESGTIPIRIGYFGIFHDGLQQFFAALCVNGRIRNDSFLFDSGSELS